MTSMLARVADHKEAETALAGNVDIMEVVVDPQHCVPPADDSIGQIASQFGAARLLSASLATDRMDAEQLRFRAGELIAAGFGMLRFGPFPVGQRGAMLAAMRDLAADCKLFATIPADQAVRLEELRELKAHGFAGVWYETAADQPPRLLDLRSPGAIKSIIEDCHAVGLKAGLSGALEPPDVARLLPLEPDMLGFRIFARQEGAKGADLDAGALLRMRHLIPADLDFQAHSGTDPRLDYRLLAARGHGESDSLEGDGLDRILVHDFILSLSIGAYDRERHREQRVRLNVEVDILRRAQATEMRDIFSYDIVTDAIRMIADEGHVDFVETFAERIAAEVLRHKRAVEIMVRVEKLDVGPGSVGIEIRRERKAQSGAILEFYPNLGRA